LPPICFGTYEFSSGGRLAYYGGEFRFFSCDSGPGFPADNSPVEKASSEHILQIPLVQGVLRGNKKARIQGLDRIDKTNWGT